MQVFTYVRQISELIVPISVFIKGNSVEISACYKFGTNGAIEAKIDEVLLPVLYLNKP